jgi:hypothetical protein
MNDHDAVAVVERKPYVALPYDDVICDRCGRLMGAFVGRAQCRPCGKWRIVLTGTRDRS